MNFLVEGSVRKAGDSVRISARLSRAATNEQVWSESYTRELKDVFAVQTEIAATIVGQLREHLGGTVDSAARAEIDRQIDEASRGGTTNTEAYGLYLRARFQFDQCTEEGYVRAVQLYQQALGMDPKFAAAWGGLAEVQAIMAAEGYSESYGAGYEAARASARRALEIEPNQPVALGTLARVQVSYDWNWDDGRKTSERAIAAGPNLPLVHDAAMWLGIVEGDGEKALRHARAAVEVDPLDIGAHIRLTIAALVFGHNDDALKEGRRVLELNPHSGFGRYAFTVACVGTGRFDEARSAPPSADPGIQLTCDALLAAAEGRKGEASAMAEELALKYSHQIAFQLGEIHALNGEPDLAFKWLEEAYRQRDSGMTLLRCDPFMVSLHGDPRWKDMIHRMRMD